MDRSFGDTLQKFRILTRQGHQTAKGYPKDMCSIFIQLTAQSQSSFEFGSLSPILRPCDGAGLDCNQQKEASFEENLTNTPPNVMLQS